MPGHALMMEQCDGGPWWKKNPKWEKSLILTVSYSLFSSSLAGLKSGLRTFQFQTSVFCPWRGKNSWLVRTAGILKSAVKGMSATWNLSSFGHLLAGQGPYAFPETCLDQFQPVMVNAGNREKVKVAGFLNEINSFLLNNKLETMQEFWHGISSWQ